MKTSGSWDKGLHCISFNDFILIKKSVMVSEIAWWWVSDNPYSKPIMTMFTEKSMLLSCEEMRDADKLKEKN